MKKTLLILVILILVAAAINVPATLTVVPGPRDQVRLPNVINDFGAQAAQRGWPTTPPLAWPAVTQWSEDARFAHRRRTAWSAASGTTTHQMQVDHYGWPLPTLRHRQFWWPWNDPAWATDVPPTSGLELNAIGLFGNPIIAGTAVWAVLVLPVVLASMIRRRRRVRQGRCAACGYPVGVSDVCSECGVGTLPSSRPPAT